MWDSYLEFLSEILQEMCNAVAAKDARLAVALTESHDKFNRILNQLKSADEDRLATFFIIHCDKEYHLAYEERKINDPSGWAEEAELLARFFFNGLSLKENGSGWGAVIILCRFKELLCRKLDQKSLDAGIKHVPASAFVYAMQ